MQIVILCGGQGARLREETQYRPKALVEISGHPVLWHVMKSYGHYGFRDFTLCLGYKGEMIKQYFLDYDVLRHDLNITVGPNKEVTLLNPEGNDEWAVTCVDTGYDTPTGGRIHRIKPYIPDGDDTFMLTYCDGLADIDIRSLLQFHQKMGKIATITAVRPPSRFGVLKIEGNIATGFAKGLHVDSGWIDGGFFVFNKQIFDYLDDTSWLSGDVRDVQDGRRSTVQKLIADQELAVYKHAGRWQCMDTSREMEVLTELWRTGQAFWKLWKG